MINNVNFLEGLSLGIIIVDPGKKIFYANPVAEKMLACTTNELMGCPINEVICATLRNPQGLIAQTLNTGQPVTEYDYFYIKKTRTTFLLRAYTSLIRDLSGTITGIAFFFHEISNPTRPKVEQSGFQRGNFVSQSPAMGRILNNFDSIAEVDSTVLIIGETGTGKEILAKTIHEYSRRRNGPFVAVNCGALPDALLESELFGYKAGAFTGAEKDKPGRFALANGGTLFLDEIGEISTAMQVKLLRVLQEKCYEPLGAVKSEKSDIRIMAATNRNVDEMVKNGTFRSDLYYRLNVIRLTLPPLRERPEDIALLSDFFIQQLNVTMGRNICNISNSVFQLFTRYSWPGNVRELENILERSMVFCNGATIETGDLPEELISLVPDKESSAESEVSHMAQVVRNSEIQAIEAALEQCGGNRRKAAELLGIHPTSLYRKLKNSPKH